MALQKIFTLDYANKLQNEVDIDNYMENVIKYDEDEVRCLKGVEKPEGLEDKMLEANDAFEQAVLLYEAYKDISLTVASHKCFWLYLTHVDLQRVVRNDWPDLHEYITGKNKGKERSDDDKRKYIKDHWLISRNGAMRTSLKNLWWSVYLTVDETLFDKYALTRVFFSNTGMRTRRLGTGHLGRNREALKGILSFMEKNPKLFEESGIENKMIWITRHFNFIGGSMPLVNQSWEYFYNELNKYKDHLENIRSRSDVTGPTAFV